MKRLYRSAVSLLIVLAVYWAYALAAVPLIEPSAPPPRPGPKGPHLGDYRLGQLAKLFPPGAWERQDPILIEIERGKLLLQKYDNNRPDGKVEISPLTVVVLPDKPAENEEQLYRQAVILKAPRALLQFDSPVELGSMKIGRLIGGQLVGEVTIHSAGAKPGTDDDLWIVTRDVQLSEKEVQTDQPVAFRWGKSFGRGSGMRIRLKPGPPATGGALSGPTASGIEQFELQRIERLHIDVPPPAAPQTARAGPAPVAAPPRLPQALGGRSLEITCRGPFCFRQSDWSASFHDHVEVRQINPQGPADQLLGDRLTLYFAPRAAGVDPATASPGDMELGRVEAWGKPVLVNAPSRPATAQGDHLVFHLRENRVVLESKLEVFLKQESQEIHARRIDYQSLEEPLLGKAVAQGPGWLRGSDPNRPNEFLTAKWQGQLQLAPEGNRQKIALMDGAELNYSRMGCLKAREICFWLAEAPSADRSQKPEWRPERMEAKTNVEIQSPDLSGSVEQLVVTFESKVAPSVYQTTPLSRSTFGRYPEKGGSEGGFDDNLVVCPFRLYQLGATAGSSSSAGNTVGQSNRGTRKLNLDRPLESSDGILPNRPHPNPLPKG
ncbi:MAG: hypothetical protein JXB10_10180, partial [Pirellulales bacterium]|nr:hypothetical protein [Pirellulales bacterium]